VKEREDLPLGGYLALLLLYEGGLATFVRWCERHGRPLPPSPSAKDLTLIGLATHKLSRLVTKERVTRPLRAPFTEVASPPGEKLEEKPAGAGLRKAVGQLLTCPYCAGPWIAAGFVISLQLRPRETRWAAGLLSSVALADFLHQLWRYSTTRTETMRSLSERARAVARPSTTSPSTV
jgi:hypothetical protein